MTQPIPYPLPPAPSIYELPPELVDLQRNRPVARVAMPDGTEAWLVSRYHDVRRILVDHRFSRAVAAGSDLETESLIGMDPPEHTRLRRIVAHAFTPRRIDALRPRVADLVAELLDDMHARPHPVDLVAHFSTPLPVQVISELFGVPVADRDRCKEWSDAMLGDREKNPAGARAAVEGFAALIEARRAAPGDDLISALIAARDEHDKLSEHELLMVCIGILVGGHETTTNQINLFVLTLLRNPALMARLVAEPADIPRAVEELTRYLQLGENGVTVPRVTTEAVELSGVTIPAGAAVLPALAIANRDPAMFGDPDRIDPDRATNPHLGFGAGVHHCLGAQLARMELQEALRGLLARMPGIRLAVAESELRFTPGLGVRHLERFPLTW